MEDFRTAYHRELALALDITDGVTAGEDQLPAGWHLRKPVAAETPAMTRLLAAHQERVLGKASTAWADVDDVWSLVAKPGIVYARMSVRGRPRRSIALAATRSAWVESSPPLTPMTIFGCQVSEPMARSRCSSPETWMLYAS